MINKVLTIAGSDSGGGAGIQADLKTFSALGVYGMSVITSVTAQNTTGVTAIEDITPEVVKKQIDAVLGDIGADAVKIGMVSNREIIRIIVDSIKRWQIKRIVLDPVMISESGSYLLQRDASKILVSELIPLADIITPNLYEAAELLRGEVKTIGDMKEAARELYQLGCKSVLVKGGHLLDESASNSFNADNSLKAVDIYYNGDSIVSFEAERTRTRNTHGTGCTYSSAIASFLARGYQMEEAIGKAKEYVTGAIRNSLDIGSGPGPTNHFHEKWNCL